MGSKGELIGKYYTNAPKDIKSHKHIILQYNNNGNDYDIFIDCNTGVCYWCDEDDKVEKINGSIVKGFSDIKEVYDDYWNDELWIKIAEENNINFTV